MRYTEMQIGGEFGEFLLYYLGQFKIRYTVHLEKTQILSEKLTKLTSYLHFDVFHTASG